MKNGVLKVKPDHRRYSLHRTFGSVAPSQFTECNYDAGLTDYNQDADGLPFGCTGYTSADICTDEDKVIYLPRWTYDKTLEMEGIGMNDPEFEKVGCQITDSLKSTIVYGLLSDQGNSPFNNRRGAYYQVEKSQGDWFDSIWDALMTNPRSISMATPWFPNSFNVPAGQIVSTPPSYDLSNALWHDWKCAGVTKINGVPYIISKAWLGGFRYFPREVINNLMSISGSGAFTVAPYNAANIQNVQLLLYQTVISYLRMWITNLTTS